MTSIPDLVQQVVAIADGCDDDQFAQNIIDADIMVDRYVSSVDSRGQKSEIPVREDIAVACAWLFIAVAPLDRKANHAKFLMSLCEMDTAMSLFDIRDEVVDLRDHAFLCIEKMTKTTNASIESDDVPF